MENKSNMIVMILSEQKKMILRKEIVTLMNLCLTKNKEKKKR
jgi:predicted transposase YbfD/YdcC